MTRAKQFMMTGIPIDAATAESWGLITQCVAESEFDAALGSLLEELLAKPPLALRTLKTVLNAGADAPLETAIALERNAYSWLRATADYEEGVTAFFEKRPPKFQGR